ncbi:MAG TPA: hypothetical protein VJH55_02360 [Candidatus Paceibacterota bacterium]
MKYNVTLASRVICNDAESLPFIPGTDKKVELDTDSGAGQEIWWGYLRMREKQKTQNLKDGDWQKIKVPADNDPRNEVNKFREAINIFMRFMTGEGRDNCLAVKDIRPVT